MFELWKQKNPRYTDTAVAERQQKAFERVLRERAAIQDAAQRIWG